MPVQTLKVFTELPPNSEAAERAVLSGVMQNPDEVLPAVLAEGLAVGDFYFSHHQLFFTHLVGEWNAFRNTGPLAMHRLLSRLGVAIEFGLSPGKWVGLLYLEGTQPEDAIEAAVEVVRLSHCRDLIHMANEVIRDARDGVMSPSDARTRRTRLRILEAV